MSTDCKPLCVLVCVSFIAFQIISGYKNNVMKKWDESQNRQNQYNHLDIHKFHYYIYIKYLLYSPGLSNFKVKERMMKENIYSSLIKKDRVLYRIYNANIVCTYYEFVY